MEARYIVDESGKRVSVVLPVEEYERMIEELEELEDALAYREAKAALERGEDELIPYKQAREEMARNRARGQ